MKPLGLFVKKDITLNEDLYNLVEGKRVAIVGPALYAQGLNSGPQIDNYDIIVRPNEVIPPQHLRCDYGSRTDIMFCNFGTIWMSGIKRKIALDDHEEHFKKLKLVVACGIKAKHSDTDYLSWPDNYVSDITKNFNEVNKYGLPFYWIGVKDYKALYAKVGVEYNTGLGAIMILLQYPIKELFVTGFTFFKGGNNYNELYYKGHMDEQDIKGRTFGLSSGHGSHANQVQINYFKKLMNNDLLCIDKEMKEVLGL